MRCMVPCIPRHGRSPPNLPAVQSASLVPDRVVVAAAVFLTCVLFLPNASDPVNIVKLTALLVCAVVLAGLALARLVRDRVLQLPTGPVAVVGLALAAAFLVATVVSPHTPTAVYGTLGRNSGLLAYGSALLLFLAVLRTFDAGATRVVLFGVLLAGLFTASYGAFQYAGHDAVGWNNPFNPIIAGLGNPDFASGYLGIAAPAAVWGALWTGWAVAWRILSAGAAVLMLVVAALSSAVQGPLAAAAGLAVLLVAWLLEREGRVRSAGLGVVAGAVGLGIAVLALGAAGTGPGHSFFSGISYRARTWYWEAALTMFRHSPVWGVGLDSYGMYWRNDRPIDVPRVLGGDHFSDAAHSVPLQMLAQGGLLLGLAYLALVALVAVCLVRGLRTLRGQERLLLGAVGACWAAYQVQSLVSIDQVPLLVVHFVLAAAVVVASGQARLREVRLPGALAVVAPPAGKRRGYSVAPRRRELAGADYALLGVVVVAGLVLSFLALSPTRAAVAAYDGDALSTTDGVNALDDYEHAIDLAPSVAAYRTREGQLFNNSGDTVRALKAFEGAAKADPFDIGSVRTSGRLAEATGDFPTAKRYYERALRLDPTNDSTILDLAQFRLKHGDAGGALTLLQGSVRQLPGSAVLWASLGDARLVTGDKAGAKAAYDRALVLKPGEPTATAGLQKLGGS
ncbi:MAG: hypothetical protein JWN17_1806 [Frankiales bacterium]|nr:hypothetical protein [Frankiales bacterium]